MSMESLASCYLAYVAGASIQSGVSLKMRD